MIAITTIVLGGPKYERISYVLCDTFLKHTQDCQLVILTDNPAAYEYYSEKKRIHIVNIGPQPADRYATLKYKCLEETWKLFEPEIIVYCDADVYLTQDLTADMFDGIQEGLTVPLGYQRYLADEFENGTVSDKAMHIGGVGILYQPFVERCMIFRANGLYGLFISAWRQLAQKIEQWNLTSAAEMIEIQLACYLSRFPLNDMQGPHVLKDTLWTHERSGATYSALR